MNQDLAALLVLLSCLAAWAWAWRTVACRWTRRGGRRWVAHLLGLHIGWLAAFGAFCLSAALFMPGDDRSRLIAGSFGGSIMLAVLLGCGFWGKRVEQGKVDRPETRPAPRAPWTQKRARAKANAEKCLAGCIACGRRIMGGQPFSGFFSDRFGGHMNFWGWATLISIAVALYVWMLDTGYLWSAVLTAVLMGLWFLLGAKLYVPMALYVLSSAALACVSIVLEVMFRMLIRVPYRRKPDTVSAKKFWVGSFKLLKEHSIFAAPPVDAHSHSTYSGYGSHDGDYARPTYDGYQRYKAGYLLRLARQADSSLSAAISACGSASMMEFADVLTTNKWISGFSYLSTSSAKSALECAQRDMRELADAVNNDTAFEFAKHVGDGLDTVVDLFFAPSVDVISMLNLSNLSSASKQCGDVQKKLRAFIGCLEGFVEAQRLGGSSYGLGS